MRIKKMAIKALALTLIICTALPGTGYTYADAKQKYKRELLSEGKPVKGKCFEEAFLNLLKYNYVIINSKLCLLAGVTNRSIGCSAVKGIYVTASHKVKRLNVFNGNLNQFSKSMYDEEDNKYSLREFIDAKVKNGMTYGFFEKYNKDSKSYKMNFLCINRKGKIEMEVDLHDYKEIKRYAGQINADSVDFESYLYIRDYDIKDNYLYMLIAERQVEYDAGYRPLEGMKYSIQCFDISTGNLINSVLLDGIQGDYSRFRPYSSMMKDHFVYGVRDNKLVKLSFDGGCVWESSVLDKKNGKVICMDVSKNRIVYCTSEGIFEVDTSENGAVPKKIVPAKQCPELKKGRIYQLLIANSRSFYLVCDIIPYFNSENDFPQRAIKYTKL